MNVRERVKDVVTAGLLLLTVLGVVWMSYLLFEGPLPNGCTYGPLC